MNEEFRKDEISLQREHYKLMDQEESKPQQVGLTDSYNKTKLQFSCYCELKKQFLVY